METNTREELKKLPFVVPVNTAISCMKTKPNICEYPGTVIKPKTIIKHITAVDASQHRPVSSRESFQNKRPAGTAFVKTFYFINLKETSKNSVQSLYYLFTKAGVLSLGNMGGQVQKKLK